VSDGFRVDLGALENAAAGVNETLADLKMVRVDALDGNSADYGHDHLAETVKDFCDRWEVGIEHLATDGREIAQRLTESVKAYLAADKAAKGRMDGIYQSLTGPDPAAQ
jgi:Excreted virulence factor EspC, type VII ESX diderm